MLVDFSARIERALVGVPGPEALGDIFETFSAFRARSDLCKGRAGSQLMTEFHVIHCVPRNYTWTAGFLCIIDGVGHDIEFWAKLCSKLQRVFTLGDGCWLPI